MMKVKMKKTLRASSDGRTVKVYEEGKVYTVSIKLGEGLIRTEKASLVKGDAEIEKPKADPLDGSPANMDRKRAEERAVKSQPQEKAKKKAKAEGKAKPKS